MTKVDTRQATKLTVLLSSPRPLPTTNPYTIMLAEELALLPDVQRVYFSWRTALLSRYDVFHVHWPETLLTGQSAIKRIARQILTTAFLLRMTVRRMGLVRTVHNVDLPSGISRRERFLLKWMDRRTDARIVLNVHTPVPPQAATVLVPHGHYVDWFAKFSRTERVPGRITYFGSIRRYKSIEQLLTAFTNAPGSDLSLTISGRASSPKLHGLVEDATTVDSRISTNLNFVDDAELTEQISAAQLVILPYKLMHNSGGTFAALSIGRPVLVPRNVVNEDLAQEVGPDWVQMFDGDLSPEDIRRAFTAVQDLPADARPDLSARNWVAGAEGHEEAYRLALQRRRPSGRTSRRKRP